jgi:hypothetical protein
MDLSNLLSFGAILLSVSACILLYVTYRRTSLRLDALTQANLGITNTIHSLISASMSQKGNMNSLVASSGHIVSDDNIDNGEGVFMNSNNNRVADKINVSDNEYSSDGSEMTDNDDDDDDDVDDDDVDDDAVDDDAVDDDADVEVEDDNTNDLILGGDESSIHIVSLHLDGNNSHTKFSEGHVEELDDDENDEVDEDDNDDVDDDDDDDDVDDIGSMSDVDIKESIEDTLISIEKLGHDDTSAEAETETEAEAETTETDDNLIIHDIEDVSNHPHPIDLDMITPIKSQTQKKDNGILAKTELFKHLKVEELRKLAIAKLGMSDDDAKKLKKNDLIKRLSQ